MLRESSFSNFDNDDFDYDDFNNDKFVVIKIKKFLAFKFVVTAPSQILEYLLKNLREYGPRSKKVCFILSKC